jgi:hypothetical protein
MLQHITWVSGCVPDTEETSLIHDAIVHRGLRSRAEVADAVTDELMRRDSRRAGGVVGVGLFRAWYRAGVERLLDRLDGTAIVIERSS